jgi:hypothetical protein
MEFDRVECVAECRRCARACEEAASERLTAGKRADADALIRLVVAAAAVARHMADLLDDDAELTGPTALVLADAYERAAAACRRERASDTLQRCARACVACAAHARTLAALAA